MSAVRDLCLSAALFVAPSATAQGGEYAAAMPLPPIDLPEPTGEVVIEPGEYMLEFPKGFTPTKQKKSGFPWDDSGSGPPDLIARITLNDGKSPQKFFSSKKFQDAWSLPAFSVGPMSLTPTSTIRIFFVDVDALADDMVDDYTFSMSNALEGGKRMTLPARSQTAEDVELVFTPIRVASASPELKALLEEAFASTKPLTTRDAIAAAFGALDGCKKRKVENIHVPGQYDSLSTCSWDRGEVEFLEIPGKLLLKRVQVRDAKSIPRLAPLLGKPLQEAALTLGRPLPESTWASGARYCIEPKVSGYDGEKDCIALKVRPVDGVAIVEGLETFHPIH